MLLHSPEMHIQFVQVLQQGAQGRALGHLGEGVDVLGEALATIAELAVWTGDIGVGVVDVAGEEDAGMHLAPVGSHLLAVLAAGVEVGDLVGSEHIVHILGQFGLQRGHDGKLFADKDAGKQVVGTGEDHGLFLEVLDMGALGVELRHVMHLVACLAREHLTCARQNSGADEYRNIGQLANKFFHKTKVLRAIIFSGDMYLQK